MKFQSREIRQVMAFVQSFAVGVRFVATMEVVVLTMVVVVLTMEIVVLMMGFVVLMAKVVLQELLAGVAEEMTGEVVVWVMRRDVVV